MASSDDIMRAIQRIEDGQIRTESKLDETNRNLSKHMEASGIRDAQLAAEVSGVKVTMAAHEEKHKEARGWWATIWTGMILAVALSVWNWFTAKRTP
jgi:hypothetical protein